jgi:uncharacterized protein
LAKIAVVGGGVAGITCAHILAKKHDVTMFEADGRLGGHACSVEVNNGIDPKFEIDIAFLIFNSVGYPGFLKLLSQLDLMDKIVPTDMSFTFHNAETGFQFAFNSGYADLFCQRKNIFNLPFLRLLKEIANFRKDMELEGLEGKLKNLSVGEYVSKFSSAFGKEFLLPYAASLWSMPDKRINDLPAHLIIDLLIRYRALKQNQKAKWLTLRGGSVQYTRAFAKNFPGKIWLLHPVRKIRRTPEGVELFAAHGSSGTYDHVVLATHANTSFSMLENPTPKETELLSVWKYQTNNGVVHTDEKVMPPVKTKKKWSSWNISSTRDSYFISYYLNRLQRPDIKSPVFFSLDGYQGDESKIIKRIQFHHPIYDKNAYQSQKDLQSLNEDSKIFYCGSYFGDGFHESALQSGVAVAKKFGMEL